MLSRNTRGILFLSGKKRGDGYKKTLFFLKGGFRESRPPQSQYADSTFSLTFQTATYPPLEANMSSEGSTFQQPMHTITDAYTCIMRHAKASMEVWNMSFPDAVRMQVINFTFGRFPITNACAPLITAHQ